MIHTFNFYVEKSGKYVNDYSKGDFSFFIKRYMLESCSSTLVSSVNEV